MCGDSDCYLFIYAHIIRSVATDLYAIELQMIIAVSSINKMAQYHARDDGASTTPIPYAYRTIIAMLCILFFGSIWFCAFVDTKSKAIDT